MLNDTLAETIAALEQSLLQTRNAQHRLVAHLRERESEVEQMRNELQALENSAAQTEKAIDSLLVATRSGPRSMSLGKTREIDDDFDARGLRAPRRNNSVAYLHHTRTIPSVNNNFQPVSNRFSDRTITQACTLLLREAGGALHVNELYNLLIAGGMKFKGENPTISVAVSLSRNDRFRKVAPGTFDLVIREAIQIAS